MFGKIASRASRPGRTDKRNRSRCSPAKDGRFNFVITCHKVLLDRLFIHPSNNVLAFVTNHAIDEQTATVKFNPKDLGLAGKNLEILGTPTNRKVPISDDGEFSLPLKSERWTYFWLDPRTIRPVQT